MTGRVEPVHAASHDGHGGMVAGEGGAVRHAIDWALVKLKDNGALDELYLRWFPVGFY